jgi:hypothetical protein
MHAVRPEREGRTAEASIVFFVRYQGLLCSPVVASERIRLSTNWPTDFIGGKG